MTRKFPGILFILFISFLLNSDMLDIYKKGEIKLVPDPEFGKGMDWEEMYYDRYKDIAIAPDGSIFVANSHQHNIQKFDKTGKLIFTFGQKGQGPGDFVNPGDISILDNKYLIVSENTSNRRISLFDLDAKFIKLINTKRPVFKCLALKKNKIAIVMYKYLNQNDEKKNTVKIAEIYILDVTTKKLNFVISSRLKEYRTRIGKTEISSFREDVFLERTNKGNLLCGFSDKPVINIYLPSGEKIKTFKLNIERKRISEEIKKRRAELFIMNAKNNLRFPESVRHEIVKYYSIHKKDIEKNTPDFLFYYYDIKIDSDGNILIMTNNKIIENFYEDWAPVYHVYSQEGVFKGEIKLVFGQYKQRDIQRKKFFKSHLFGLFERKSTDDIVIKLLKMKLQ